MARTATRWVGRTVVAGSIALVGLAALLGGGGTSSAQSSGTIRIGFIYPNSGPLAQLGIDLRDGFLLYWSEVGHKAGGRPVEVILETKASAKPDEGLTKARKLVERDRVHLLGGIISTPVAYALRSYVIEQKTPLVIMNAGADGLTQRQRSPFIFRPSFSNSDSSHPLGEWAAKRGYRKMVLMGSDFGASYEHMGGLARTFTEAGGQIIQEIYPPLGTPDFAPYLAQIRRDADVVAIFVAGADAIRFVKQYEEYGLKGKIPLIGKALAQGDVLSKMGDSAVGIVNAFHWYATVDTPENRRFMESFAAKYKRPADDLAEQGYVGAQVIAQALEAVKGNIEDQEAFLAALRKVEVNAPRGKVRFDPFQNVIHTVHVLRVEKRAGAVQNLPIASFPDTTQFWKWSPDAYLALTPYAEMKGKWVKP